MEGWHQRVLRGGEQVNYADSSGDADGEAVGDRAHQRVLGGGERVKYDDGSSGADGDSAGDSQRAASETSEASGDEWTPPPKPQGGGTDELAPKQRQLEHVATVRTAITTEPSDERPIPSLTNRDSVLYILNGKVEQGRVVGKHKKKKGWLSVRTEDGKLQYLLFTPEGKGTAWEFGKLSGSYGKGAHPTTLDGASAHEARPISVVGTSSVAAAKPQPKSTAKAGATKAKAGKANAAGQKRKTAGSELGLLAGVGPEKQAKPKKQRSSGGSGGGGGSSSGGGSSGGGSRGGSGGRSSRSCSKGGRRSRGGSSSSGSSGSSGGSGGSGGGSRGGSGGRSSRSCSNGGRRSRGGSSSSSSGISGGSGSGSSGGSGSGSGSSSGSGSGGGGGGGGGSFWLQIAARAAFDYEPLLVADRGTHGGNAVSGVVSTTSLCLSQNYTIAIAIAASGSRPPCASRRITLLQSQSRLLGRWRPRSQYGILSSRGVELTEVSGHQVHEVPRIYTFTDFSLSLPPLACIPTTRP
jgi:hypothetical protein